MVKCSGRVKWHCCYIHCQKFWRRSLQWWRRLAETAAWWCSGLSIKDLRANYYSQFYARFLFVLFRNPPDIYRWVLIWPKHIFSFQISIVLTWSWSFQVSWVSFSSFGPRASVEDNWEVLKKTPWIFTRQIMCLCFNVWPLSSDQKKQEKTLQRDL